MKRQLSAAMPAPDLDLDLDLAGPALEITDFHGASPGWDHDPRLLIVAGVIAAALVIAALTSARGPATVAPASSGPVAGQVPASTGVDLAGRPAAAVAPGPLAIVTPAVSATVRGSTVLVTGRAEQAGPLVLAVRLGRTELGRLEADLGAGPYALTIPVHSPATPLAVDLVVETVAEGAPVIVATRSFVLSAASAVDVWSVMVGSQLGGCHVALQGVAPLTVATVSIRLIGGNMVAVTDEAVVRASPSVGAHLLGQGEWVAHLDWPPSAPVAVPGAGAIVADPVASRLELAWHDPADGTTSTRSIPIAACGG
jgi:hypothetical protein